MLVFAAIAPHGGDVIAEIAADPTVMQVTRAGMEEMGRRFVEAAPDTVVVVTPHGALSAGKITVGINKKATGTLGTFPRTVSVNYATDEEFIAHLHEAARVDQIPLVGVRMQKPQRRPSPFSLDWGVVVPLWFTGERITPKPQLVVLAEDRNLPREVLVRMGVAIARAAETSGKRVALIASCDLGHAHDPDGPYGFDPTSEIHDKAFCDAITSDDLPRLLDWPEEFLEAAKVDAFWQTLILMGALGHTPMQGELISYEAPTYFGMAVATYLPTNF